MSQPGNPLHEIKLGQIVTRLQAYNGWQQLARMIDITCFKTDPLIKSSFKFLRRTPWARTKADDLYVATFQAAP